MKSAVEDNDRFSNEIFVPEEDDLGNAAVLRPRQRAKYRAFNIADYSRRRHTTAECPRRRLCCQRHIKHGDAIVASRLFDLAVGVPDLFLQTPFGRAHDAFAFGNENRAAW